MMPVFRHYAVTTAEIGPIFVPNPSRFLVIGTRPRLPTKNPRLRGSEADRSGESWSLEWFAECEKRATKNPRRLPGGLGGFRFGSDGLGQLLGQGVTQTAGEAVGDHEGVQHSQGFGAVDDAFLCRCQDEAANANEGEADRLGKPSGVCVL